MIKYKCVECGSKLETTKALAGQPERCPACGKLNTVPADERNDTGGRDKHRGKPAVLETGEAMEALRKLRTDAAEAAPAEALLESQAPETEPPVARPAPPRPASSAAGPEEPRRTSRPPARTTLTETACGIMGWISMVLGFAAPIIFITNALRAESQRPVWQALLVFVGCIAFGVAAGVFWFALQQALRYLRRSMNAIERLRV